MDTIIYRIDINDIITYVSDNWVTFAKDNEAGIERSEKLLTVSSICKKVETPEGEWIEVEDAIVSMKLFEKTKPPKLTHGLCPSSDALFKARIEMI